MRRMKTRPLGPLELGKCETIGEIFQQMEGMSFGARELGRSCAVLCQIVDMTDVKVVLTVSGAMTVAKLGRVFSALIERSLVDLVVTTGAVVTHELVYEAGFDHFAAPRSTSDQDLWLSRCHRIHDSLELGENLDHVYELVNLALRSDGNPHPRASCDLVRMVVESAQSTPTRNGFLQTAVSKGVKVFVPALTDSELGLAFFDSEFGSRTLVFDPMEDLRLYRNWLAEQTKLALITIGGGVPRNWAQQMLAYLRSEEQLGQKAPKVVAAVRICPDAAHFGHLSGSTFSEGISWGKFELDHIDNYVEVLGDATMLFPFLAKAMLDHADANKPCGRVSG